MLLFMPQDVTGTLRVLDDSNKGRIRLDGGSATPPSSLYYSDDDTKIYINGKSGHAYLMGINLGPNPPLQIAAISPASRSPIIKLKGNDAEIYLGTGSTPKIQLKGK